MSNFKRVLEIEKKFDHHIKNVDFNFEKNLEQFISDSKLKEDVIITDFKKNLDSDFNKSIGSYNKQAKDILKNAENEADFIRKNSDVSKVTNFILEEIKNV